MQHSRYLVASDRDTQWGLTVSTVGYEEIPHDSDYPTKGHAEGYYFQYHKGRILREFQLQYVVEGEASSNLPIKKKSTFAAVTSSSSSPTSGTPIAPPRKTDGNATG